jgi:hypothetical protein
MDNHPLLLEAVTLSEEREVHQAIAYLRAEWLRLYMERRPYSEENCRRRRAICDKIRRWRVR